MASTLARAILTARRAAELTQHELALRLGLKAHAIGRWEQGHNIPRRRNQQALIAAIRARNPAAADALAARLSGEAPSASVAPQPVSPPRQDPNVTLELAVFRMADELDIAPRRLRGPLLRWLRRVRATDLGLDDVQAWVEQWVERVE